MSASGRFRPVVTVGDFSDSATCYAGLTGQNRPEAVGNTSYRWIVDRSGSGGSCSFA